MFVRRYCSVPVMSPARRSVLNPAQRPTWLSYPSAATTHFASIVISSSRRFARIPRTEPSSLTTAVAVKDDGSGRGIRDRKSPPLNSSHPVISYAPFCLPKKPAPTHPPPHTTHSKLR